MPTSEDYGHPHFYVASWGDQRRVLQNEISRDHNWSISLKTTQASVEGFHISEISIALRFKLVESTSGYDLAKKYAFIVAAERTFTQIYGSIHLDESEDDTALQRHPTTGMTPL
jgi:hypothetical protein